MPALRRRAILTSLLAFPWNCVKWVLELHQESAPTYAILDHNGLRFYYEAAGNPNNPPLLIISGLTDYTAKCAWQMPALAADFHVITFDNRGAGRSTTPEPGYTMADLADDAAAVLSALGVAAAHVFGFSMGGMVALNLVLRHPERVRGLVLGCTSAGGRLVVQADAPVLERLVAPPATGDRRRDFLNGLWVSLGDSCRTEDFETVEQLADAAAAKPQKEPGYIGQLPPSHPTMSSIA